MADRVGAEIGRREMPPLDRGVRIVGGQRLDGGERRDRIVGEAHPAQREGDVAVERPQRRTVGGANIVRRAAPARPAPRHVLGQVGGADPCARKSPRERGEARDQQPPQRQHAQPPLAGGPVPPMAALRAHQHGGGEFADIVGEPQHLATEGMADHGASSAGRQRREVVDHRRLVDAAPLLHRRGLGLLRLADAAIVVGQHREAARGQMLREGAVELPRDPGAAVHQYGDAVGRRGLEEGGGEPGPVSRGKSEVEHDTRIRPPANDDKRIARRLP